MLFASFAAPVFARVPASAMLARARAAAAIALAWRWPRRRRRRSAQGDKPPGRAFRRTTVAGNKVELTLRLSDTAPTPLTFTVDNPARIALDLPDTTVAMASRRIDVKQGALDTVNVAEANGRTRVVLNVDSLVPYETRVQGNTIIVTLGGGGARAAAAALRSRPPLRGRQRPRARRRAGVRRAQRQQHRLSPRRRRLRPHHRRTDRCQGARGPAPGRRPHRRELRQDCAARQR